MTTKPTRTQRTILAFLDAHYATARQRAEWGAEQLLKVGAPSLGISPQQAERQGRIDVARAELLQRFLDETIRPHLGADGLLGANADRQLRLLAWGYSDQSGYDDAWQPGPP